ncbi:hypothetical protein K6Q96_00710 [Grimontia kaedaensis]|uniref:Lipopolysaccharide biosynthesis protein n=1 Tax=Grimontia kaedaensis TaxID=2872157 RepID=A0ABY4WSP2_9GAMM|nr:hypothetical protein [Grimontia kaedaensis]USH02603.1 hypothetical protein K6Q96_00710 [Grimontia kaedaensis]
MTSILLIADNRTNLIDPLLHELERKKIETTYIDASSLIPLKKYPTIFHRIKAKMVDELIFKRKRNWGLESFIKGHCKKKYDHIVILIPAMLTETAFTNLKSLYNNKFTCIFWDSLNKSPAGKIALRFCTDFYSFDMDDCKINGINHLPTYIDAKDAKVNLSDNPRESHYFGVFGIESLKDKRLTKIQEFANKNPHLKGEIYLISRKIDERLYKINNTSFIQRNTNLVGDELEKSILNSHCLLDIVDERQVGLSPRIGTAFQFKRKLITNNSSVAVESWFENNVKLITPDDFFVPIAFIEKDFRNVENPYSVSNWIDQILS